METKYFYTLKEIILGLRGEYQLNQQKLEQLKSLCSINERKVEDYRFYISDSEFYKDKDYKKPVLRCEYTLKRNLVQKFITNLSIKLGMYIYDYPTIKLVEDNNEYHFYGQKNYPVRVKPSPISEKNFNEQVENILTSDFANNITSNFIEESISDADASLYISPSSIDLYIRSNNNGFLRSGIQYDSKADKLVFESYEEDNIDEDLITKVLKIQVPASKLNSYHIKFLKEGINKPVAIEKISSSKKVELDIKDQGNQFVLTKINK